MTPTSQRAGRQRIVPKQRPDGVPAAPVATGMRARSGRAAFALG